MDMGDSSAKISSNGGTSGELTNVTASKTCPNCRNELPCDLLAGFPAGVMFSPSDQQLIEHLESVVMEKKGGGSRAHALIHHFIQTIEGDDDDICYTHPENLPGVTRDGNCKYFFHKTSKAYPTSSRKRRKVPSERGQDNNKVVCGTYWHKTGKTRPVIIGGRQKGCKKILVLHNIKQVGKRESTNWVMHQYHLGMNEEEEVGELVLSKVFYRCPTAKVTEQSDENVEVTEQNDVEVTEENDVEVSEQNEEEVEATSEATPNILPISGEVVTTATAVNKMPQLQQQQLQRQAQGHGRCKLLAPATKSEEDGVVDPVSGDQGQVQGNNNPHIPLQHQVQSGHMEPATFSAQVGVGDLVSGDQVHGNNNHHIPSQHHVQSVDTEPDTTLSLGLGTGWFK